MIIIIIIYNNSYIKDWNIIKSIYKGFGYTSTSIEYLVKSK